MAACCTDRCHGTDRFFTTMAGLFDRQYRKHGLEKIQRLMLSGLRSELRGGERILDIGCGVGAVHLALLKEGASEAIGVDVSQGMLERARRHAEDLGFKEKTVYIQGDFVERRSQIPQSDVAILDKVVCCYPDVGVLVESSASAARLLLVITHPRNNLIAGLLFKSHIAFARLFRLSFHPYWHDWDAMRSTIAGLGFEVVFARSTAVWQALVFKRIRESVVA